MSIKRKIVTGLGVAASLVAILAFFGFGATTGAGTNNNEGIVEQKRGVAVEETNTNKHEVNSYGQEGGVTAYEYHEHNAVPKPEFKIDKIKPLSEKQGEEYYTEVPFSIKAPYAENVRILICATTATRVNVMPAKGNDASMNDNRGTIHPPLGWAIADINNPKGKFLAKIKTLKSIKEEDIIVKHVFDIDLTKPMDLTTLKLK